ncbi:MAG: single-stranded DNA-binding protein [Nitrospirae bacterium GWB2_47_37]|nr:MAG: single-stranded DNA-binding protein [Nitrospirae bacterium GWA2_46_11]OGW24338.1 MAG: single-stranded DNA-binding protein [Nitrospirae bacterium GWB2_47_37]HAK88419.1 single-stranded DNA-binding protein [Nitrospiraceae bacterium]
MFNKIILIGNLTKDPDVRYTPGGTPVTTMRLAVTSKYKQGDEMKEDTLFIDAVVFGKQAESCGQYLSKGNPVLVEGRLRERKWESEGTQRSKVEVITSSVRFLPKRESRQASTVDSGTSDTAPPDEISDLEPF